AFALQPAQPLHPVQQRIQGPRTDLITMPAQLHNHPLAMERLLTGVMQDMHLPKAQQNFTLERFHLELRWPILVIVMQWPGKSSSKAGRGRPRYVTQASSPAGFGTVPVPHTKNPDARCFLIAAGIHGFRRADCRDQELPDTNDRVPG